MRTPVVVYVRRKRIGKMSSMQPSRRRAVEVALHVMPGHLWRLCYDWDDETADEYPASEDA
jgi:hypothetical protein